MPDPAQAAVVPMATPDAQALAAKYGATVAPAAATPDAQALAAKYGATVTPSQPTGPNVSPDASDDDVIRSAGFDPALVKQSARYQAMVKQDGSIGQHLKNDPSGGFKIEGWTNRNQFTGALSDVEHGLELPLAGLAQLARHGLNKLGLVSDADMAYSDMMARIHNQDYLQNVREGKASPTVIQLGSMLFPMPGGNTVKSLGGGIIEGALRGTVAGVSNPVLSGPPSEFGAEKLKQGAEGAVIGGLLGTLGKTTRAAKQFTETSLPETAVAETAGKLQSTMENTPWGHLIDIQQLAEEGGERAGAARQVLEQIQHADTPLRIAQASANVQRVRAEQLSDQLYHDVEETIRKYNVGNAPLASTATALRTAEANAALGLKDPGLNSTLKEVRRIITPESRPAPGPSGLVDAGGRPIQASRPPAGPPSAPYDEARKLSSQIEEIIRNKKTAENALVGDRALPLLQRLKNAIDQDLYAFTQKQNIPELRAAAKMADDFYRDAVVPYKDINIARQVSNDETDRIFQTFLQKGGRDRAQKFYNALDPKGRAAVQYQLVADAMNKATDPVKGFNSGKFVRAMDGLGDAYGVFFEGSDKMAVDGMRNLVLHAAKVEANPAGAFGPTKGLAITALPRSDKVLSYIMQQPFGRRFLYAASSLKPGTPAMQKVLGQAEAAAARWAVTSTSGEQQPSPRP